MVGGMDRNVYSFFEKTSITGVQQKHLRRSVLLGVHCLSLTLEDYRRQPAQPVR